MATTIKSNRYHQTKTDSIRQEALPYPETGLAPYISSKTLSVHYGKHHKAYIDKTNSLIKETDFESLPLKEIMLLSAGRPELRPLFNNAAQAWNHSFYWKSMRPAGGGKPGQELQKLIKNSFGTFEDFIKQFQSAAAAHFGSGWIWLVKNDDQLKITESHDADNPLVHNGNPLIALDVWEHAYYLDYQNERAEYAMAFLDHLINWNFAESQLT